MADETKELLIKISATTELLRSQLSSAERSVAQFERRTNDSTRAIDGHMTKLNKGFGIVKASIAGFAGGLAFGAIDQLTGSMLNAARGALEYGSSLLEASQQIGVSVEALQELRFAAEQSGIAQEEIDGGLQKLNRSIGQAAAGNKKVAATFRELGVPIQDTNGKLRATEDIFRDLLGSLAALPDQQRAAASGSTLMGRSYQQLAPLVQGGTKNLDGLSAAYRRLDIAITTEQAKKLDDSADAISRLKTQLQGKVTIFLADNADQLQTVVDLMGEFAANALKAASALKALKNGELSFDFSRLDNFAASLLLEKKYRGDLLGNDRPLTPTPQPKVSRSDPILRSVRDQRAADFLKPQRAIGAPFPGLLAGLAGIDFVGIAAGTTAIGEAAELTVPQLDSMIERLELISGNLSDQFSAEIAKSDPTLALAVADRDSMIDLYLEAEAERRQLGEQTIQTLGGIYEDIFSRGTSSIWDNFRRIGISVISEVLAQLTSSAITGRSTGGILGLFGEAFKSVGLGGFNAGANNSATLAALSGIKFGGFRANGGPVLPGMGYVIGENGPEWFEPKVPGSIISNKAMAGTVNNFDLRGAMITEKVYADMQRIAAQTVAQAGPGLMQGGANLALGRLSRPTLG